MKPSEELMLLLELNNFDITRFKLKKHLEYEENGNIDLFIHQTYADLVISHYQFDESLDIRHRNPLTFNHTWDKGINSLSQFYVNHQDVNKEVTLGDFLLQESINEIRKENVLNDILYAWIDEHKTSSSVKLENYRELLILLPKKDKSYKKPSNIKFFVAILLSLLPIFLYAKPSLLQPSSISFVSNYIQDWNNLLSDFLWYYLIGIGSIILLLLYAVLNKVYAGTTNNVKDITKRKAVRIYSKWEKEMTKSRLKQLKVLKAYSESVLEDPTRSFLDLNKLNRPEILIQKYKGIINSIEHKYDSMIKNYRKHSQILFRLFRISIIIYFAYIILGYALIRGWISV